MTRFLRHFMRLSGATPVLSMHVSKPAEGKERKHRVRGASAWRNATRLCWWIEAMEGGTELDPIKANRLASRAPLRVKRTVTADPEHPMMWKAAHIALDTGGDVVGQDVLRVMRWVQGCQTPPTSNEVEAGDHGVPRDRARAALGIAHTRTWLAYSEGPRRSRLWTASEAGRARLLLEGGQV